MTKALPGVPALPRQFPAGTGQGAPRVPCSCRGGSGSAHPSCRSCSRTPGVPHLPREATAAGCALPGSIQGPPAVPGAPPAVPSSPHPRGQPGGPQQLRGAVGPEMGPEEPLPRPRGYAGRGLGTGRSRGAGGGRGGPR